MTKKIAVIFNGPPNSGKDFICDSLILNSQGGNVKKVEFKKRLYKLVMAIYGIPENDFFSIYSDRTKKEQPMEIFGGLSIRQAMIKVSEYVIKPHFGLDYFGEAASSELVDGLNVFPDGGFVSEFNSIHRDSDLMLIIRIHADGCNFDNDSRSYIEGYRDAVEFDVFNDKTEKFVEVVNNIINENTNGT